MNCHGEGKSIGRHGTMKHACCGGEGAAGRFPWIAVLLIGALILSAGFAKVAGAGWLGDIFQKSPAASAKVAGVVETADEVKIPLKALDSGKAIFLQAKIGGKEIHYFAVKSSDGAYRSAYDACDVCFRANRGYSQDGDQMVCNNCGMKFPLGRIGDVKGGCNPHPLANRVEGDYLTIRKADIAAGDGYFAGSRQ